MSAHAGIDLGPRHGGVAVAWPEGTGYTVTARGWDSPEGAADARAWLGLVGASLPVPLAAQWHVERPHVDPRRAQAGAAQYRSLVDWTARAHDLGAVIVEVAPRTWRADYGLPQGAADACRESRALVRRLWPSVVLGPRDHVADACLLALRAAGGVAWARARVRVADGRAAGLPEWVAAQIAKCERR